MHNRVVAIVQARMGSKRLPGKMMLELHGTPIAGWIHRRLATSELLDEVVFAIPDTRGDEVLEEYLDSIGATTYRGSEENVLDRFFCAATTAKANIIVRICGDNPCVSGRQIDTLINFFLNQEIDYAYNHIPKGNRHPDGLGGEICRIEVLEKIHKKAASAAEKEHVFNYIWNNAHLFRIKTFEPEDNQIAYPNAKLDIDTSEDLERMMRWDIKPDSSDRHIVRCALNDIAR